MDMPIQAPQYKTSTFPPQQSGTNETSCSPPDQNHIIEMSNCSKIQTDKERSMDQLCAQLRETSKWRLIGVGLGFVLYTFSGLLGAYIDGHR